MRFLWTQTILPCPETSAMLFWALLASGQITMRKVDGWQTLAEKPSDQVTSKHKRHVPRGHTAPERPQIGARRFARREAQRRQPPRRAVDEHDQRATRTTPLESIVRAGVDLDRLAEARAARAVESRAYHAAASVSTPRVRSEAAEPSRATPRSLPAPPAPPPPAAARNPCPCPEESLPPDPPRPRPDDDSTPALADATQDPRRPVPDGPEQAASPAERKAPAAPPPASDAKPCSTPTQSPRAVRAPPNSSPKSPRPSTSSTLPEGDIPTLLKGDILMLR